MYVYIHVRRKLPSTAMHAETREDDARRTMERSHSSWMLAPFWHFVIMGERVRANADNICICLSLFEFRVSRINHWTIYMDYIFTHTAGKGMSICSPSICLYLSICSHLYLYISLVYLYISLFLLISNV